ncbi:MAG TPA: hypothetical protein VFZ91_04560 [Allosphingosinicella sp.]
MRVDIDLGTANGAAALRRDGTRLAVALALLAAGCAYPPAPEADVGRIYSYVRSNRDGSEAETIHVYRARADLVEVTKMRERCTNAAFVTATLSGGEALRLTGGRLRPGATHEDFAELAYRDGRIEARVTMPQGELRQAVEIADRPWRLYDFDFADFAAAPPAAVRMRRDFAFGVALIWLGDDPADFLRYLGRADAHFVRAERREGRAALRYQLGGPAFAGALGGPLWLDARNGFVVGAELGRPNHAEYRDFKLRLTGLDRGAAAWKRLLEAHFEGC